MESTKQSVAKVSQVDADKALAQSIWHKATSKGMDGFYWQAVARTVLLADGIAMDPDNDSQHKRLLDALGQAIRNVHPNKPAHWLATFSEYNEATHLAIIATIRAAHAFYKGNMAALPAARVRKVGNSKYSV